MEQAHPNLTPLPFKHSLRKTQSDVLVWQKIFEKVNWIFFSASHWNQRRHFLHGVKVCNSNWNLTKDINRKQKQNLRTRFNLKGAFCLQNPTFTSVLRHSRDAVTFRRTSFLTGVSWRIQFLADCYTWHHKLWKRLKIERCFIRYEQICRLLTSTNWWSTPSNWLAFTANPTT